MKTLALDAHSANFTLEVMTADGKVAQQVARAMSAKNLIEVIQKVTGPKTLVVEECHLAQWIKRTTEAYVDRVIICDPGRNHWIAQDQFNDDSSSAHKLALLYRGGFIKEVEHPTSAGATLRGLFQHYYDLNQQITRFKNKLKADFRQEAIVARGNDIYEEPHGEWLKSVRDQPHIYHAALQHFELVDKLKTQKTQTFTALLKLARKEKIFKLLQTIPGLGAVLAAGYLAMIENIHRFSRKNKLWSFSGLANLKHTSDEIVYEEHASPRGNRVLKWVVMEHFLHAVERSKDNRFVRQYEALRRKGLDHSAARRQVCRALLATVRAVWRKEEEYRDNPLKAM